MVLLRRNYSLYLRYKYNTKNYTEHGERTENE